MADFIPARCYNWANWTIQQKRSWIDAGPGAAPLHGNATSLASIERSASPINQDLTRHLRDLEVDWRGQASEAAQARLRATSARMDATSSVTTNGSGRLNDYGDSFSNMAPQIVYDDPEKAGLIESATRTDFWQAAVGSLDSRLSFDDQNQVNSAQADHALTVHAANTSDVASRFGTETEPARPWSGGAPPGGGSGGGSGAGAPSAGGSDAGSGAGGAGGGAPGAPGGGGAGSGPAGPPTTSARFEPPPPGGPPGTTNAPMPGGPGPQSPGGPSPASPGGWSPGGPTTAGWSPTGPSPAGPSPAGPFRPGPSPAGPSPAAQWTLPGSGGGGQPIAPRADPRALPGADRAARFEDSLRNRQVPMPRLPGADPSTRGAYPGQGGAGGWGGSGGGTGSRTWGGSGGGTWGGSGGGSGGAWGGSGGGRGPGQLPEADGHGTGTRGGAGRPGFTEPTGSSGPRAGERGAGGYGPMMGGAGAGSAGDQEHRNRYTIYSDKAFRIPLDYTDPVIGPDEEDDR